MQAGLDFVRWVQEMRSPFFDLFFKTLSFFDTDLFYVLLVPIILFGFYYKAGLRLILILFLSQFSIQFLKTLCKLPRPFHLIPSLGLVKIPGYGFPSGAATNAVLLGGLFLLYAKSPWKWIFVPSYVFLISLSRVYLGVHFFGDILGGWALGLILLALVYLTMDRLEKALFTRSPFFLFFASQLLAMPLFLYKPSSHLYALILGLFAGLWISSQSEHFALKQPNTPKEKLWCSALGVAITIFFFYLVQGLSSLAPSFTPIWIFMSGIAIYLGGAFFCQKTRQFYS